MTIPLLTRSESNQREHWAVKAARVAEQRSTVRLHLASRAGRAPSLPCAITLTRVAPRKLDDDNLRGALKAVRDGVADWLVIDDGNESLTWHYAQAGGSYAVRIELIEIGS